MQRLKVGVVGVGNLGQHHARIYASLKDEVELVGVADTEEARAREVAKKCGTEAFVDYHPLLERCQAVSVAVPTRHHHIVGRACLQRGVHMLLEKPITVTLEQADDLLALAKEKKAVLQVGHIERFNPAIVAVRKLNPRPLFIEVHRMGPFSPRTADVGVVFDLMIHDIDIVLLLKGEMPSVVQGVGAPVVTEFEDVASARLEFPDGCLANLAASRISRGKTRKILIACADSTIAVDYMRQTAVVFRVREGTGKGDWMQRIRMERPSMKKEEPLKLEIQSFIRSVKQGSEPEVSGEKARAALAIATRIAEDIRARLKLFSSKR